MSNESIGIIIPPPAIKKMIETTANSVAKYGRSFENKILSDPRLSAKMLFLNSNNPYHTYYLSRVEELAFNIHQERTAKMESESSPKAEAETNATSSSSSSATSIPTNTSATEPMPTANVSSTSSSDAQQSTTAKTSYPASVQMTGNPESKSPSPPPTEQNTNNSNDNIDGAVVRAPVTTAFARGTKMSNLEQPPPDFMFLNLTAPGTQSSVYSALDLEVVKLTAYFTVVGGRKFLSDVSQREQNNPHFAFLRHGNILNEYFTTLVDHYRKIVDNQSRQAILETRLKKIIENPLSLVDSAVYRINWARKVAEEQALASPTNDDAGINEIDWYDFVVAETIDFPEEDVTSQTLSAPNKAVAPPPPSSTFVSSRSSAVDNQAQQQFKQVSSSVSRRGMDMDMDDDDDNEGNRPPASNRNQLPPAIKVRSDYVPKVVEATPLVPMVTLPDGKMIPAQEMNAHIKVELQDPKYKIQMQRYQKRQEGTNYDSQNQIYKNLARLRENRPDVFGTSSTNADDTNENDEDTTGEQDSKRTKR